MKKLSLYDRMMDDIKIDPDTECWLWTGSSMGSGYGVLRVNNIKKPAHRAMYELKVDLIPEGFQLDHLCKNKLCVNPNHLEIVTQAENMRRNGLVGAAKRNAKKLYCKWGHKFTTTNTYIKPDGNRACQKCKTLIRKKIQGEIR